MSNLSPIVLVCHEFHSRKVAQLRNGYINASVLAGGNAKVIQYSAEFQQLLTLLGDEMSLDTHDLAFVHNGEFYLHPFLVLHFASWLGMAEYLAVSGWVFSWLQPQAFKIKQKDGDVFGHLRRCYRIDFDGVD